MSLIFALLRTYANLLGLSSRIIPTVSPIEGSHSAGDPLPPKCAVIQVHVAELKHFSIDPSPFRNKDLDPKAEEFIVGWAKDVPRDAPLGLVIDLDRTAGLPDEPAVLRDAIHEFFLEPKHFGDDCGSCFAWGVRALSLA
jgi:hypothetical protein